MSEVASAVAESEVPIWPVFVAQSYDIVELDEDFFE